jgi:hypothetical protein
VRALTRPGYGWQNHPAVRMWRGYEETPGAYGIAVCREWQRRGHADSCAAKIMNDLRAAGITGPVRPVQELRQAGQLPPWLGDEDLHRSHRSALVRKDPNFYRPWLGRPAGPALRLARPTAQLTSWNLTEPLGRSRVSAGGPRKQDPRLLRSGRDHAASGRTESTRRAEPGSHRPWLPHPVSVTRRTRCRP